MVDLTFTRSRHRELGGTAAIVAVATMVSVMFMGSTLLTPLYVIYRHAFGFSQITLTLVYATYVVGNLLALLVFGRLSDEVGRRRATMPAIGVAVIGTLMFLLAQGTAALFAGRALSGLGIGVAAGTGTAWLAELVGSEDKTRATVIATGSNFFGIAIGPLLAGVLAQYAPWPLHLSFIVYLVLLLVSAALVLRTRETVTHPAVGLADLSLRPRLGVPRAIRAQFVAPAITGFGAMALVGFYAALAPSILANELHNTNHAVAGALVFELAIVVSIVIVLTQKLASRAAMLWSLALMIPSAALVVAAQLLASMPVMLAATALCGIAAALGYRGSLQVVNQIAPAERRAEVVSTYFVCGFSGNALPVIGVGVLSTFASAGIASAAFAVMIVAFAGVALIFGAKYTD
ncbi:MAG TPA: MFS transporter [Pseudolabrys sp.]|nr:MFS transporter [Pseudolabrys sp.]